MRKSTPKTTRVVINPPILQPMMTAKLLDSNGSKRKQRGCVYNDTNMIQQHIDTIDVFYHVFLWYDYPVVCVFVGVQQVNLYYIYILILICIINIQLLFPLTISVNAVMSDSFCFINVLMLLSRSVLRPFRWWDCALNNTLIDWLNIHIHV